jgi:hypothetical protein
VGHGDAVPDDAEALATVHPVDDLSVVVPQLPFVSSPHRVEGADVVLAEVELTTERAERVAEQERLVRDDRGGQDRAHLRLGAAAVLGGPVPRGAVDLVGNDPHRQLATRTVTLSSSAPWRSRSTSRS